MNKIAGSHLGIVCPSAGDKHLNYTFSIPLRGILKMSIEQTIQREIQESN